MKNFQQILIEDQQTIADPFIYTTPQVQNQMLLVSLAKISKLVIGTSIASILLAPLQTISSSLQLSVLPHKDLFISTQSRSKQLARLNTQLTIAEKRSLQLLIRTGGEFRPYTAPVYTGYQQAVRNLARQGWKAFFKGLAFRLVTGIPHAFCYGGLFKLTTENDSQMFGFTQIFLKFLGVVAVTDMSLNIFHILQNRYILQNNIKQFRVFRSLHRVIGKMITRGQLLKGNSYHIGNAFIQIILKSPAYMVLMLNSSLQKNTVGLYYLAQTIIYPFSTAYKRFVCQSPAIPGMIPTRYSSVFHAVKVIAFQEKIKGLYKGYGLYTVNIMARLLIMQTIFRHVDIQQAGQF